MIWYLFLSPINFALTNFFLKDGLHRASNSVWYFPIDKMICIKKSIVFLGLYSRKQELVINRDDLYENIFSDFVDPFRVYFGSCVDYTLLVLFNHFFDKNAHFSWKKFFIYWFFNIRKIIDIVLYHILYLFYSNCR